MCNSLRFRQLAVVLAISSTTCVAWGSGSIGIGGNASAGAAYHQGKALFHDQLACDGCPLDGLEGQAALDRLASAEVALSANERSAVAEYLKRRYRLK